MAANYNDTSDLVSVPNMKANATQTTDNINSLNKTYLALTDTLNTNGSQFSQSQINNLQQGIESVAKATSGVVDSAEVTANITSASVKGSANTLTNSSVFNKILNNEIKNAEDAYFAIKQDNTNKLRMIEINRYYTERYKAQSDLMKLIIFFTVPLLLITILSNKGILSKNIAYILGGAILIGGIIMVIGKIYDINNRDNMDFSKYNIDWDPSTVIDKKGSSSDIGSGLVTDTNLAVKSIENKLKKECIL